MDNTRAVAKLYLIKKSRYPVEFMHSFDKLSLEETAAELKLEIPTSSQLRAFEEVHYLYVPEEILTQYEIDELIREESLLQCYPQLAEVLKFKKMLHIKKEPQQEAQHQNDSDTSPLHSDEDVVISLWGHYVPRNGIIEHNGEKVKVRRRIRHKKPEINPYDSEEELSQIFKNPVVKSNVAGRFERHGSYRNPFQPSSDKPQKNIISAIIQKPLVTSDSLKSCELPLEEFSFETENPYYINGDGNKLYIKRCEDGFNVTIQTIGKGDVLEHKNEGKSGNDATKGGNIYRIEYEKHKRFVIDYRFIHELGYRKMSLADVEKLEEEQKSLKDRLDSKKHAGSSQNLGSKCDQE